MENMVYLGTFSVREQGKRGRSLTVPSAYREQNGIQKQDQFSCWTDGTRLVYVPTEERNTPETLGE